MRALRTATFALLAALLFGVTAQASGSVGTTTPTHPSPRANRTVQRSSATTEIQPGRVLVRLKGAPTAEKLGRMYASADTSAGAVSSLGAGVLSWRVPAGVSDAEFAAQLQATGDVEYAELNHTYRLAGVYTPPSYVAPNEAAYTDTSLAQFTNGYTLRSARSWWLRDITAPEMWAGAYTGPSVTGKYPLRASGSAITVAVLDTGFWITHPDRGNVVAGWDTYSNDADVTPPDPSSLAAWPKPEDRIMAASHGTNVAGLIGAQVANGIGSFGSGYDTTVVMYKISGVSNGDLSIPDSAVVKAITMAADSGCKIISMSFTDDYRSNAVRDAVNYAYSKGCILVAARGNNNNQLPEYPACLDHVVGVGALVKTADGSTSVRADFSSYGTGMDLSAPGDYIWGLTKPGAGENSSGYDWWAGTSMATPITAGGLALLWRAMPDMTGDEIVTLAEQNARDLNVTGWDVQTGFGELNMLAAYNKLKADYPLLSAPAISAPTTDNARMLPVTWSAVPGYQVRYNVDLDGVRIATGLTTTGTVLPNMSIGLHTLAVTPTSPRNWSDSTAVGSRVIPVGVSLPVILSVKFSDNVLSWKSTESSDPAARYRLAIDGGAVRQLSASSYDVSGLSLGDHSAMVSVVDSRGVESSPVALDFRVAIKRLGGSDRYAVNTALAYDTFPSATTAVMVAGDKWPDALSASPLAAKLGGPVLLSRFDTIPTATKTALTRLGTKKVVIVGGTGSVSDAVVKSLRASGITVTRLAGPDRYTTANAVALELWRLSGNTIPDRKAMVASGLTHQDALIASSVAARRGWPVLLTSAASVPASTRTTLGSIGVTSTVVVGSTSAVSATALAQLPAASRITASTSAGTSVAVANWALTAYPESFTAGRVYLASNSSAAYADSLGVGVATGRTGAVLLLTPATLAPEVSAYYSAHTGDAVLTNIMGGTATIPQSVYSAIKALVGAL